MVGSNENPYLVHTNWRSTCSARLRLALNLKGIPYDPVYVDLDKDEQKTEEYLALNPSGTVPSLQSRDRTVLITQSLAAIEYVDEMHPDLLPRLLPSDPYARATVRSLAYMIACDVQPLTTTRVSRRIRSLGGSSQEWSADTYMVGLEIYEKRLAATAGTYSYGDTITLADVCLVPAVWKALMLDVKVESLYPAIWKIFNRLSELEGVVDAHGKNQADFPRNLKPAQG